MYMLQATGAVYWDAIGSIAVSALLGVVAITLIQRNRKWLIGKSMPKVSQTVVLNVEQGQSAAMRLGSSGAWVHLKCASMASIDLGIQP